MKKPTHIQAFGEVDLTRLPDIHALKTEREQILWVLGGAKASASLQALTATQVSDILRDHCHIALSRQRAAAILAKEKGTVTRVGRSRPPAFKLMKKGEDELFGSGIQPVFVSPEQALSSIRRVEEILAGLEGEVRICDTYIDSRTLDYLAVSKGAASLRLLTENIQDSSRLKRDLAAFAKEHAIPLEIRQAPAGLIHDRYVIDDKGMMLFGTSFKDLGKKQTIIVALPKTFATEMVRAYDRLWGRSTKFS